jgi:putative hydrolase of the HAD superfamily
MTMKNLIIDLDNTIYPVSSIGDKLFSSLFALLSAPEYQLPKDTIKKAKEQIMKIPFQKVAQDLNFPEDLTEQALDLLRNLTYDEPMTYFEEYPLIRDLKCMKFLLTTGFKKLQESKIRSLHIQDDFTEIMVIDPHKTDMTKKDGMIQIMAKYRLKPEDLLVIGDDPDSLIDKDDSLPVSAATYKGRNLAGVLKYL